ncbi:MAG: hypothetical protein Q7T24_00725 [Deltaproteobacteria bacterium]|nr:hypothetical protein [Deltaproteobacteria bacterium]
MGKRIYIFAAVIFSISAAAFAFNYPAKLFVPLIDQLKGGASGELAIERFDRSPDLRMLGINVYGLKPNSTYSVWLTNDEPQREVKAAGIDTNHFRTDGSGNGRYVTTASEYEIDHWRFIEVNFHPDNDPKNTKGMITALRGDLKYGAHS